MSNLEKEIKLLKDNILELMFTVKSQLEKGREALVEFDEEMARQVIINEKRVDSLELTIDRDCAKLLALYNPVAVDLRFVMAVFKINADLERIGDHANGIAKYMLDFGAEIDEDILRKMKLDLMYSTSLQMVNDVFNGFIAEDTKLAAKVFKLDETLNSINRNASSTVTELIQKDPGQTQNYLYLLSIIRKLERVGDLTKNIAEEFIFYIEAKVLKHQKEKTKKAGRKEL